MLRYLRVLRMNEAPELRYLRVLRMTEAPVLRYLWMTEGSVLYGTKALLLPRFELLCSPCEGLYEEQFYAYKQPGIYTWEGYHDQEGYLRRPRRDRGTGGGSRFPAITPGLPAVGQEKRPSLDPPNPNISGPT